MQKEAQDFFSQAPPQINFASPQNQNIQRSRNSPIQQQYQQIFQQPQQQQAHRYIDFQQNQIPTVQQQQQQQNQQQQQQQQNQQQQQQQLLQRIGQNNQQQNNYNSNAFSNTRSITSNNIYIPFQQQPLPPQANTYQVLSPKNNPFGFNTNSNRGGGIPPPPPPAMILPPSALRPQIVNQQSNMNNNNSQSISSISNNLTPSNKQARLPQIINQNNNSSYEFGSRNNLNQNNFNNQQNQNTSQNLQRDYSFQPWSNEQKNISFQQNNLNQLPKGFVFNQESSNSFNSFFQPQQELKQKSKDTTTKEKQGFKLFEDNIQQGFSNLSLSKQSQDGKKQEESSKIQKTDLKDKPQSSSQISSQQKQSYFDDELLGQCKQLDLKLLKKHLVYILMIFILVSNKQKKKNLFYFQKNQDDKNSESQSMRSFNLNQTEDPNMGSIQKERSRSREKKIKRNKLKEPKKNKISEQQESITSSKNKQLSPLLKPKQQTQTSSRVLRTMKDIQGESLRTSNCFQAQSFKWTSRIQNQLTVKKGIKMNEIKKQKPESFLDDQLINLSKKFDSKLQKISEIEEVGSSERLVNKNQVSTSSRNQNLIIPYNDDDNIQTKSGYINMDIELEESTSNIQDIFSSVDTFAQTMSLFKKKLSVIQKNGQAPKFQFQYHSSIDNGSFGQVDLYFFNQNNLNLSDITPIIPPFNSQNYSLTSSLDNKIETIKNSKEYRFDNILQSNDSELISNTFSSQKQLSQQQSKNITNSISTVESSTQMNSQEMQFSLSMSQQFSLLTKSLKNQEIKILPAAGKKIKKQDEFVRELYIMQYFQSQYMPSLFGFDTEKQILYMELGLCNLFDLKQDSINKNYRFSDEFTYQTLLNIIKAIESFISFKDQSTGQPKPMFHSDIKPQNIILTASKSNDLDKTQIKLLLIDYGGASIEKEDYWTYYTPAFVNNILWSKFVNDQNYQDKVSWEEIRFAEVYAACRTIQYIIVEKERQNLFKKENQKQFIFQYWKEYPQTIRLINTIFQIEYKGRIDSQYRGIFLNQEIFEDKSISSEKIVFEAQKIFELSKLKNNYFNQIQFQNI